MNFASHLWPKITDFIGRSLKIIMKSVDQSLIKKKIGNFLYNLRQESQEFRHLAIEKTCKFCQSFTANNRKICQSIIDDNYEFFQSITVKNMKLSFRSTKNCRFHQSIVAKNRNFCQSVTQKITNFLNQSQQKSCEFCQVIT